MACSVISVSGVPFRAGGIGVAILSSSSISSVAPIAVSGAGDCVASGVGNAGIGGKFASSKGCVGATDALDFLFALTLGRATLFFGEVDFFSGSAFIVVSSVDSNICNGSTDSASRVVRRVRVAFEGEPLAGIVVRRVDCRVPRGAGVNSSSLSSFTVITFESSSDDSTTAALRRDAAALRVGREGDNIVAVFAENRPLSATRNKEHNQMEM